VLVHGFVGGDYRPRGEPPLVAPELELLFDDAFADYQYDEQGEHQRDDYAAGSEIAARGRMHVGLHAGSRVA